jgi:hypothetical protein
MGAHDDAQANASGSEYGNSAARFDFCGIEDGPNAGGDGAANEGGDC